MDELLAALEVSVSPVDRPCLETKTKLLLGEPELGPIDGYTTSPSAKSGMSSNPVGPVSADSVPKT